MTALDIILMHVLLYERNDITNCGCKITTENIIFFSTCVYIIIYYHLSDENMNKQASWPSFQLQDCKIVHDFVSSSGVCDGIVVTASRLNNREATVGVQSI